MTEKCEYPFCNAKAKYHEEYSMDDSGEQLMEVPLCPMHYNAICIYNEERDDYEFRKMSKEDRLKVSRLGYRLKNSRHDGC
jgi:hypothetical protein